MLISILNNLKGTTGKVLIVLLGIIGLFVWHLYEKNLAVEKARAEIIAEYTDKYNKSMLEVSKTNIDLLQSANEKLERKQNEINSIIANRDAIINELRSREARSAATIARNASDTNSCTGAKLFREDADFLTREAARADKILKERDYYFSLYEKARLEINSLAKRQLDQQ